MKQSIFIVVLLLLCSLLTQQTVRATEGGSSYYFPGSTGTFAAAVAPDPGFSFVNEMLFYHAKADEAVLRGRIHGELEAGAFYNYIGGFYTFEKPILGGRFQIGAMVPIGYEHISAGVDTALGSHGAADTTTKIGDSLIMPSLYWRAGNFHFKLAETIYLPTGEYKTSNLANIGRNYYGFDTSLAITWLYAKTGTEITVIPGIMFNTENAKTDYQSGNEFHMDFMVNQFLAKNFAVGIQGYWYDQVTSDGGSGAQLGDFRGKSVGIGPALLWMPDCGKNKLSLIAKWLHDIEDKNRMAGDYGQFIVNYKF